MGDLLANSERFADIKSAPGVWDRIAEKGKAVWDSAGEAVDDAGRALRRAVTIDSPAEARARADEIALRRTRNQVAADLRAHGWGDNGLVCMRLGPTAMAFQPASVNSAYYDSFDQRIAWSTNEALQLYAGGALIDAVAIPILTTGGKLAVRFFSDEAKLSYGLRHELRSSVKTAKGAGIEPAQTNRMSNVNGEKNTGPTAAQRGAEGRVKGGVPIDVAGTGSILPKGATFEGTLYRASGEGYDPLLIHAGNVANSHRYTGPGQGGLYFATGEHVVEAEFVNNGGSLVGTKMHAFPNATVPNLLDISNPAVRESLGVSLGDLTRTGGAQAWRYEVTQPMGSWAEQNGYNGIIVPSAQANGGVNLIIFDAKWVK